MDFESFVNKLEQFGFRNDSINNDFEYLYENNSEIGSIFYQGLKPLFERLSERNGISFSTGEESDKYKLKFYLDKSTEDASLGTFIFSLNLQERGGYLSFSQTKKLLINFPFQAVLSDGEHPIVSPTKHDRSRVNFLELKKASGLAIIPNQGISQYWQACLLELGISFSDTSPQFWQRCDQTSQPAEQAFLFGIARQVSQILRYYNAQAYSNQDNQLLYQAGNATIGGIKFGVAGLSFEFNLSQANSKQISFYQDIKSVLSVLKLPFTQEGNWLKIIIDSRTFTKATTLVSQWYQTITPVSPSQHAGDEMKAFNQNGIAMTHSPLNQILFGPPGTGKTFHTTEAAVKAADPAFYGQLNINPAVGADTEQRQALTKKYKALSEAGRIRFVTFHQSYGYEEFVEGLKAETTEDNQISYKVSDGIFKSISNAASVSELSPSVDRGDSAPLPAQSHVEQHNHVLVIDEINRGNISKIFGELITLIEESKRAGNNEEIALTLPYSGKTFSVPNNLFIIGTMNTADRSLAMMDTALRRRFDFKEMMPKPELFNNRTVKGIDLTRLLETLNKRIEVLYDREHILGHAFLFPVFNEADEDNAFIKLKDAFKNKIIPLLEEYFYEDWNKIRLVLGDNQKEQSSGRDYTFIQAHTDSFDALFGHNHGLETYEDSKVTYKLKDFDDAVWSQPEAYVAIYSKSE
ncbi:McrB family protein [Photobacterium swingsii]|uniref:McrB family protein n=1 Tax=Photobacterium swingsii TaxID=680026 RepID=UPI00352EAA7C